MQRAAATGTRWDRVGGDDRKTRQKAASLCPSTVLGLPSLCALPRPGAAAGEGMHQPAPRRASVCARPAEELGTASSAGAF